LLHYILIYMCSWYTSCVVMNDGAMPLFLEIVNDCFIVINSNIVISTLYSYIYVLMVHFMCCNEWWCYAPLFWLQYVLVWRVARSCLIGYWCKHALFKCSIEACHWWWVFLPYKTTKETIKQYVKYASYLCLLMHSQGCELQIFQT